MHRDEIAGRRADALFAADPGRGPSLTFACGELAVDFSKQRMTPETLERLVALARERDVPGAIERLFTGQRVNVTEDRPALHTALRGDEKVVADGEDILAQVQRCRERMRVFSTAVRDGSWKGATGEPIRHVLALGIGGSYLGPKLVAEALAPMADGPAVRFIANVDPAALDDALAGLDPASTLVVVASKTFTTQETMANAAAARRWIAAKLGEGALARHMVAATAHAAEAARFGIPECNVFPFAEWVGGRFSVWSSVGLPVAIAIGMPAFERFLAGAHAVDSRFPQRAAGAQRPAPPRAGGRVEPRFPRPGGARGAPLRAAPREPAGLPAAAGDGIHRQARGRGRQAGGLPRPARRSSARRAPSASMRSTSGCTRAPRRPPATSSWSPAPWARAAPTTTSCWPMRWPSRRP